MITMLLGGLWHGANWTFVAWGALHGFYLWVEKAFRDTEVIPRKTLSLLLKELFVKASFVPEINHPKTVSNFILALGTCSS